MKPANPARHGKLLASIGSKLAKIEKSDMPELSAGPRAFNEWVKQPGAIEVSMGWMKTAINDELIFTRHMADCSAIVLCTNYDESTGTDAQRSLMHVVGSNLSVSDLTKDTLTLLDMASQSLSKPRCIIALGTNVANDHFTTIANQEIRTSEGNMVKPFKELQTLCDTVILERKNSIAVRSDGNYLVL
jgi:hypothetical protein